MSAARRKEGRSVSGDWARLAGRDRRRRGRGGRSGGDFELRIDGHTNQVPVKPKYFASDWDLSAARAVTVLRHLSEVGGIPGSRLSAEAFGHEKPLIDPSKPGSQRVNKRVDIVVVADLSPAARAVLAAAFPHQNDEQSNEVKP